ncbi:hypothetical protein JIN84_05375 [Luteolibacter yonseiensis]|uniref:Abnormal spindle-like microcephaly-associated protein ASH domain-containing protein n=1 Tax=Luteolibacter yonseiensis TaxID=1144680 RepID=A0A934R4C2_9BACT|nr:hypothetical protein [Luteolibacter yonseiensis]MBK1815035.1 hypothetical protein [Luteolibacter yonseiensis]
MNRPLLSLVLFVFSIVQAHALTDSQLAAAIADGRALVFMNSPETTAPGQEPGWKLKLKPSSHDFNFSRPMNDINGSFTMTRRGGVTSIVLAGLSEDPITLTLSVSDGVGTFRMTASPQFDQPVNGIFHIKPKVTIPHEITVRGAGSDYSWKLYDGKSTVDLGIDALGNPSFSYDLVIKNAGATPLKGLRITTTGADRSKFSVSKLKTTTLAPGKRAIFTVSYDGKAPLTTKRARLHIWSNDKDESPFDINVTCKVPAID